MKKYILFLMVAIASCIAAQAEGGDNRIGVHAGFLFPSTLNAVVSFEHEMRYGNAIEVFGEAGDHWQQPTCCQFWKGYYWDGGFAYKHRLVRYKNGLLRMRFDGHLGAVKKDFYLGCGVGFEYDYVFPSGVCLSVMQKNDFNFLHGDHFRNGLLLGIKIPL